MSRGKPSKNTQATSVMDEVIEKVEGEKLPLDSWPTTTLREYRLYNEEATKQNKKLGMCRYKIKQCPPDLHPKQRIIFRRNDQPSNPLKVFVSDDKIHFDETLVPGKTYDLPEYIIHYLSEKGNPIWQWVDNPDGSRETRVSHKEPRFSLNTVYAG